MVDSATFEKWVRAAHQNGHLTLAEIRDALPDWVDKQKACDEARKLDEKFFYGRTRAEVIAILLSMLTVHLLPD